MSNRHRNWQLVILHTYAFIDQATDPLVWQAVVVKNIPPHQLILTPHSEALSLSDAETKAFKRPRHLHPALQTKATAKLLYEDGDKTEVFELRSPLLGKGGLSPPAYWAVLAVEGEGNMFFKEYTVPVDHPPLWLKGTKKKPSKKGAVQAAIVYALLHICGV